MMDSRMRKDLGPQMIQGLVPSSTVTWRKIVKSVFMSAMEPYKKGMEKALLELAKHDIDAANKIATDVLAEISELEEKP